MVDKKSIMFVKYNSHTKTEQYFVEKSVNKNFRNLWHTIQFEKVRAIFHLDRRT